MTSSSDLEQIETRTLSLVRDFSFRMRTIGGEFLQSRR